MDDHKVDLIVAAIDRLTRVMAAIQVSCDEKSPSDARAAAWDVLVLTLEKKP